MEEFTLKGLPPGNAFNPAVVQWNGRTLMIYRTGWWGESTLFLGEVDQHFHPVGEFRKIDPIAEGTANEDARFFVHRGKLHISFCVYQGKRCSIATAIVTDDLQVLHGRVLKYDGRQITEKNWIFFEHGDDLYCTYVMADGIHQVLRVEDGVCRPFCATRYRDAWTWGSARGGTPLVWRDGLWYGFFHGTFRNYEDIGNRYFLGAYAVRPEPPFPIVKISGAPLYTPTETRIVPAGATWKECIIAVVFPGGLIFENGHWIVTAGYNDEAIKIFKISQAEMDLNLVNAEVADPLLDDQLAPWGRHSMVHFPSHDPNCTRVAEIIQDCLVPGDMLAGPDRFASQCPDFIACKSLNKGNFQKVQWLLLHKGLVVELNPNIRRQVKQCFTAVYADEFFVLLTSKSAYPMKYDFDPNQVQALWIILDNMEKNQPKRF